MTHERKGLCTMAAGYLVAVGFAALFSGSVVAPLTAVPVACATGLLSGYFLTR